MPDLLEAWKDVLPDVKQSVTGVGVWTALNRCVPVTLDEGTLVIGLPHTDTELGGHLRMGAIRREIEKRMSAELITPVRLRVIEGVTLEDYERIKRKDAEARRLQEQAMARMRQQLEARTNWEGVFEELGRRYAAITNKSQPQSRARFLEEAVAVVVEARRAQSEWDDMNERNFARCLERVSQYTDVPSTLIAQMVLRASGEL